MGHPRYFRWLLAAYFTLVFLAGEALHLLPGCGHFVELPGNRGAGIYALLPVGFKIDYPEADPETHLQKNSDSVPPVLEEGECPICSFVKQARELGSTTSLDFSPVFSEPSVGVVLLDMPSVALLLPLSRGPPAQQRVILDVLS